MVFCYNQSMNNSRIKTITVSLFIIAIAWIGYVNIDQIQNFLESSFSQNPCQQPIAYSIGTVDSRFGMSRDEFLKSIEEAAQIWEKPFDKTFFYYSDGADLKVNLVYDSRQDATLKLQELGLTINNDQASYNALKAKYDSLISSYNQKKKSLDGIVTKVYEFKHNRIKENIGGIYDFLRKKKIENLKDIERKDKVRNVNLHVNTSTNKQKYLEKKEFDRNLRKLRKRLEESETVIENIEAEIIAVDKAFMEPGNSSMTHDNDYKKYQDLKEQLNEEMNKWALYSQEVEEFLRNNS